MNMQTFANVWDAICDDSVEAENMKLRSDLMCDLSAWIRDSSLSQAEAAKLMGVSQPRVSDLMRGKINLFSLDALVNMAASAGQHVHIELELVVPSRAA
jgi:predicted XRE-type DNA-binding protein